MEPVQTPRNTTLWSVVLLAKDSREPVRREALNKLCETYWPSLYAYLRLRGFGVQDAEDLIQGFFAYFLGNDFMSRVDPARGRFRNYLLSVLRNYVGNEIQHARRDRRGGSARILPLDVARVEAALSPVLAHIETPEAAYQREWTLSVLRQAHAALKLEFSKRHGADLAAGICAQLASREEHASYEELSRSSGRPVSDITNLLHAARRGFRRHIRAILRETVESESEVDEEVAELFKSIQ